LEKDVGSLVIIAVISALASGAIKSLAAGIIRVFIRGLYDWLKELLRQLVIAELFRMRYRQEPT
jgi:hypothetical protein